jgi:hypothetical protein
MSVTPAAQEAEIGMILVWGQPGQKVSETPIWTKKPCVVVHAYDPSYKEA